MATVDIGDREITFRVRRSERARRIALRIRHGEGLEVVLPQYTPVSSVEHLVKQHARWIVRKLDSMPKQLGGPFQERLETGTRLAFAGKELTLKVSGRNGTRVHVSEGEGEVHVRVPEVDQTAVRTALQRWYTVKAKALISRKLAIMNAVGRFHYSKISVRNQKTRWGSCSRKGTLSFNWRLLLLPPDVMDYLIYHELAHLEEMNHSGRFWRIVAEICPQFRESEAWLKKFGPGMM